MTLTELWPLGGDAGQRGEDVRGPVAQGHDRHARNVLGQPNIKMCMLIINITGSCMVQDCLSKMKGFAHMGWSFVLITYMVL